MSYDVLTTPQFDREVKKLSKKYRSLKADLNDLSEQLSENPMSGDPLGENLFKVRLAISSKGRGKSGGGRVVTFLRRPNAEIYLIAIYDKSEIASLSKQQIKAILKAAGLSNEWSNRTKRIYHLLVLNEELLDKSAIKMQICLFFESNYCCPALESYMYRLGSK